MNLLTNWIKLFSKKQSLLIITAVVIFLQDTFGLTPTEVWQFVAIACVTQLSVGLSDQGKEAAKAAKGG